MNKTIPKRTYQRWDGGIIYFTKDCEGCDFYREINNQSLCGWGIAFKYLVKKEKPKKCAIRNIPIKEPWIERSYKYLDSLIKGEEFKEKNQKTESISMPEMEDLF